MDDTNAIVLSGTSKWYGEVLGLSGVNLELPSGGVYGLLGPNGAGKSTLMGIVTGLINPSAGTVHVFGLMPPGPPELRSRIGMCPEGDPFYPGMSARDFLIFMGCLAGLDHRTSRKRTGELLEELGIAALQHREPLKMSKGEKQRVKLAQSLLHDPDLLLLDEPLSGMDPLARWETTQLIRKLGREGRTLLVSSHILQEIEAMTDTVVVLNAGKMIASGTVHEIRAMLHKFPHRIRVSCDEPAKLARELLGAPGIVGMELTEEGQVVVRTTEPESFYKLLNSAIAELQPGVQSFFAEDQDLASVFRYLVPEG